MTQPKMSFVMPAYRCEKTIGRALESLFDQDYKNFEVIVVFDGPDDAALKALMRTPGSENALMERKLRQFDIPHAGACAARNAGARHATGDYISFFSSDFVAEPGMLRRWIEVFQENPDADFVYGHYKFWDLPGQAMYTEPHNPYVMTCYPYIDGGFPVKREVWEAEPWDEDFKSLNDWEWLLRISLAGYKGVMIPDFSYSAQAPQPGGLSEDSARNWLERVGQIKKKHNIPDRDICFCSLVYPEEAKTLAQMMGQDVQRNPSFKPGNYKMIYQIGFSVRGAAQCLDMFSAYIDAKKVIHWMPMDVSGLKQLNLATIEILADAMKDAKIMNLACTPEDVKFLNKVGFRTRLSLYYATRHLTTANGEFRVWMPPDPGLIDIAKGMPDIEVTGNRHESSVDVLLNAPWGEVATSLLAGKMVVSNVGYDGVVLIPPQENYPALKTMIVEVLRILKNQPDKRPTDVLTVNERQCKKELQRLCRKK